MKCLALGLVLAAATLLFSLQHDDEDRSGTHSSPGSAAHGLP
jgi:hypothetical protein